MIDNTIPPPGDEYADVTDHVIEIGGPEDFPIIRREVNGGLGDEVPPIIMALAELIDAVKYVTLNDWDTAAKMIDSAANYLIKAHKAHKEAKH